MALPDNLLAPNFTARQRPLNCSSYRDRAPRATPAPEPSLVERLWAWLLEPAY